MSLTLNVVWRSSNIATVVTKRHSQW